MSKIWQFGTVDATKSILNWGLRFWRLIYFYSFWPFDAQEDAGVPFHRNFNSILRRDHEKNSYKRQTYKYVYESVDEKSLS